MQRRKTRFLGIADRKSSVIFIFPLSLHFACVTAGGDHSLRIIRSVGTHVVNVREKGFLRGRSQLEPEISGTGFDPR